MTERLSLSLSEYVLALPDTLGSSCIFSVSVLQSTLYSIFPSWKIVLETKTWALNVLIIMETLS